MVLTRERRIGFLIAVAATFAVAAIVLPPIAQPTDYHRFADARRIFGIDNFWNVATNLAFLVVGSAGLSFVLDSGARFGDPAERRAYVAVFAGVVLTSVGSAWYHLAPDNERLVWDRLPMTIVFMSLVAAFVSERVDARAGARLLVPLIALGMASVAWWWLSARSGHENLNAYIAVQFGSIAIVLAIAALFRSPYDASSGMVVVIALYAAAKAAELMDAAIPAAGVPLSGHSFKHLIAAGALYALLRVLQTRSLR